MLNCAVMNADYRELTWWQYQALLNRWNAHHSDEKPAGRAIPEDRLQGYIAARSAGD